MEMKWGLGLYTWGSDPTETLTLPVLNHAGLRCERYQGTEVFRDIHASTFGLSNRIPQIFRWQCRNPETVSNGVNSNGGNMRAICIQAVLKTMVAFSGQHYHGDLKKEQKFDNLTSVHTYIYMYTRGTSIKLVLRGGSAQFGSKLKVLRGILRPTTT